MIPIKIRDLHWFKHKIMEALTKQQSVFKPISEPDIHDLPKTILISIEKVGDRDYYYLTEIESSKTGQKNFKVGDYLVEYELKSLERITSRQFTKERIDK